MSSVKKIVKTIEPKISEPELSTNTFAEKYLALIDGRKIMPGLMTGCETMRDAAISARRFAKEGQMITVTGPRGGKTRWRAVGAQDLIGVRQVAL